MKLIKTMMILGAKQIKMPKKPFNIVKWILDNHQKTLITIIGFIVAAFIELGYDFAKDINESVKSNEHLIQKSIQNIEAINLRLNSVEGISKSVVTRASFNDYISRKDNEYHTQLSINDKFSREIGALIAKSEFFEKFLYEINDFELSRGKNDKPFSGFNNGGS